jgi:hypothetical protein
MGVKWISLEGSEGYTVVLPADLMSLLAEAGNSSTARKAID